MVRTGKLAVIGDRDSVLAFKAIGAEVYDAADGFEAASVLRELVKQDVAVVFVTEELCAGAADVIEKLKSRPYPAVIPIPSAKGGSGFGMAGIKRDVEKAVGVDILFNKD